MLEKQLKKKLKTEVEKLGGLCLKLVTPGFTGIPDRLVIMPGGNNYFIEMKAPGGELSERQKTVTDMLKSLGCNYFLVSNEIQLDTLTGWLKFQTKHGIIKRNEV